MVDIDFAEMEARMPSIMDTDQATALRYVNTFGVPKTVGQVVQLGYDNRQIDISNTVSCPTCQAKAQEWCRKVPDKNTTMVRTGARHGRRRRTNLHEARLTKYEMFCEAK